MDTEPLEPGGSAERRAIPRVEALVTAWDNSRPSKVIEAMDREFWGDEYDQRFVGLRPDWVPMPEQELSPMNVLDAAKALAAREPLEAYGEVYSCVYCRAVQISDKSFAPVTDHAPDCPWLQLPRIVAALEAAETFVEHMLDGDCEGQDGVCRIVDRLGAALKGEA